MPGTTESPSTAVDRTIAILEAVAARSSGMNNAEISRKLDIPKSSASYILRTLEKHGYLRRNGDDGKYRLGLKVLNLGHGALSAVDVREVALPMMRSLVEHVHITSHLAIPCSRSHAPSRASAGLGRRGRFRCCRPMAASWASSRFTAESRAPLPKAIST